jgi:hypothetical protein
MENRVRHWAPWSLAAWLALAASMSVAQAPADALVQQLRDQGYVEVDVSRTLLGRIRVVALTPDGAQREIVLSPATGEILRDYSEGADGAVVPRILDRPESDDPSAAASPSGKGGSGEQPRPDGGNRGRGGAQGSNGGNNPGQGHRD